MAKVILRDAFIQVDGTNLSNFFSEVAIESEKNEVDLTGFGSTYTDIGLGLGDASITGTLFQDFDAASVDSVLWPLHNTASEFPVVVRPTSAAKSATNPEYQMTAVLPSYSPLSGSVGDASTIDVSFRNASQAGLARAIA